MSLKANSNAGTSFWIILCASLIGQGLMWFCILTLLPHVCGLLDRITS